MTENADSDFTIANTSIDLLRLSACTILDRKTRKQLEEAERIARSIPFPEERSQRRASFTATSRNPLIGESSFLHSDENIIDPRVAKVKCRNKKSTT